MKFFYIVRVDVLDFWRVIVIFASVISLLRNIDKSPIGT